MDCDKMMRDQIGAGAKDMHKNCMDMMQTSGDKVAQARTHTGVGVVRGVDASAGTVTLQHEPIQSIGWPAMTMPFSVQDKTALQGLKPGQKVEFAFVQQGSKSVIKSIK